MVGKTGGGLFAGIYDLGAAIELRGGGESGRVSAVFIDETGDGGQKCEGCFRAGIFHCASGNVLGVGATGCCASFVTVPFSAAPEYAERKLPR
jgi:hypothetical protein